jgi:hypothetical protein
MTATDNTNPDPFAQVAINNINKFDQRKKICMDAAKVLSDYIKTSGTPLNKFIYDKLSQSSNTYNYFTIKPNDVPDEIKKLFNIIACKECDKFSYDTMGVLNKSSKFLEFDHRIVEKKHFFRKSTYERPPGLDVSYRADGDFHNYFDW